MLTCPIIDLQTINKQLQQIMLALDPNSNIIFNSENESTLLTSIQFSVSSIFNCIVNNTFEKVKSINSDGTMYNQMEKDLQKQQNLNRLMIKKQLQIKEYQKCLADELNQQRKTVKKLQLQLSKVNQRIVNKDMEISHLNNQKKIILSKDRKSKQILPVDLFHFEKKTLDQLKQINKELIPALKFNHLRRRSDDILKRPNTANSKKKGSVSKR